MLLARFNSSIYDEVLVGCFGWNGYKSLQVQSSTKRNLKLMLNFKRIWKRPR